MATAITPDEAPPADGLLDGEEHVERVVLGGDEDEHAPYPRGTFTKIGSGMITLAAAIATTYLVPDLHWARPWVPGQDPMLFWNVVGRVEQVT